MLSENEVEVLSEIIVEDLYGRLCEEERKGKCYCT